MSNLFSTMFTGLSDSNPLDNFIPPVAVVANDAGAANIIFEWLANWNGDFRLYLDGPAKRIWTETLNRHYKDLNFQDVLSDSNTIFTGTGWASDIEFQAIQFGNQRNKPTICVIDHWVNYSERFVRNGLIVYPNEIIVTDNHAFKIANEIFSSIKVIGYKNLYLQNILESIPHAPNNGTLLYVLEPVRNNWGRDVPGEFQSLDFAIKNLPKLPFEINRIVLRPHPSEHKEKYQKYLEIDSRFEFDQCQDLSASIASADIVVGVESYSLAIAALASRIVYTSTPPWGPKIRLPNFGIKYLY